MPEQLADNVWKLFDNEYIEDENSRIGGGTVVRILYFDDPPMMQVQGVNEKWNFPATISKRW